METASVGASGVGTQQTSTKHGGFADVNLDDFLKMLIAELQNQDPMEPMNNQEILQQVAQIRDIESNNRLTGTLQTVLLGQNMSTASGLINRVITGLSDDGQNVTGRVDRVSVAEGTPTLHVGDQIVKLTNVSGIAADAGTQEE